jgi:hypothetical protein
MPKHRFSDFASTKQSVVVSGSRPIPATEIALIDDCKPAHCRQAENLTKKVSGLFDTLIVRLGMVSVQFG